MINYIIQYNKLSTKIKINPTNNPLEKALLIFNLTVSTTLLLTDSILEA